MCEASTAGSGKCELGHQTDPVAAYHPGGDLESAHAGCLPGCFADTEREGKAMTGVCPVLGWPASAVGSGSGIGQGHCLVSLEDMTEVNRFAIKNRRHGIISRFVWHKRL